MNFSTSASIEGVYLIANRQLAGAFKTREEYNRPEVKIAVYMDTAQERVARKFFPRATLVPIVGDDFDLDAAIEGQAHASLVTTFAPRVLVGTAADKLFLPFAEALVSTETAIAVRKGDADFVNYLNSWLSFQRGVGWLEERARYWAEPQDWMKQRSALPMLKRALRLFCAVPASATGVVSPVARPGQRESDPDTRSRRG